MTVLPKSALAKIGTKEAFTLLLGNSVKRQQAPNQTDNRSQKYIGKKSPFVPDFGCNR